MSSDFNVWGDAVKDTDIQYFRTFLIDQKSSILNKTTEFKNEQRLGSGKISEDAELASVDLNLNISLQQIERQRSTLVLIEKALGKISEGTYGQCESCGCDIGLPRLKARPFASLCIECMEDQETPSTTH